MGVHKQDVSHLPQFGCIGVQVARGDVRQCNVVALVWPVKVLRKAQSGVGVGSYSNVWAQSWICPRSGYPKADAIRVYPSSSALSQDSIN